MKNDFLLQMSDIQNTTPEYIETLFTLSNGHMGLRGSDLIQDIHKTGNPGTFVNGFYEKKPIIYGEWAYGYAENHQTIIKLPDIRGIILTVNGHRSDEEEWMIKKDTFMLNMAKGLIEESYQIQTINGESFRFSAESFTSFEHSEIYTSKYIISDSNFSGEIVIEKDLSVNKKSHHHSEVDDDPRVASMKSDLTVEKYDERFEQLKTHKSQQSILFGQVNLVNGKANYKSLILDIKKNEKVTGYNFVIVSEILKQTKDRPAINELNRLINDLEYDLLLKKQEEYFNEFWTVSDIELSGQDKLQKGIRFNLFQLFQNAGRNSTTNFAAKGLTGEGYEGHYFWDTEMYILPFFIYTQPDIAKSLLTYRSYVLPQAKKRAEKLHQKGALFAWRTIDGDEASAYYPAGTAQVHINADISHAFQLYERVTGDHQFMKETGAEIVFETARFWLSFGHFGNKEGQRQFCIDGVTGPDEYTALVNNNYYTNKMAQSNLSYAVELAGQYPEMITEFENSQWQDAARNMYLPYDEKKQIIKQDDSFLDKEVWPFEETPKENYPLLLHYHPMIIYKYQVSKQADGLLAPLLFPNDYDKEQIIRDYNYYEGVTTHDSSLSRSVFSILASRTGQKKKAYNYFMDTALMDIVDLQGNAKDGVHAANMGGSWLSLIYGFAGLSYQGSDLIIENNLPDEISNLAFTLNLRGNLIKIYLNNCKVMGKIIQKGKFIQLEELDNQLIVRFNR